MSKVTKGSGMVWFQRTISLPAARRGCHYITDKVKAAFPEIGSIPIGVLHLTLQHTSASICLNECWDADVLKDTEDALNLIIPESTPFRHTCEGPDDMPGHVKTALVGTSLSIPVTEGKLAMGTWQGIWLLEHRNHAGSRKIVATLQGAEKSG